eukprot:45222-Eustigmatos_ZCMA.PRE.1
MDVTGLSRDDVKQRIVTLMDGGRCFPDVTKEVELPDWLYQFMNEMNQIREAVYEKEPEFAKLGLASAEEKRKKEGWGNAKGSTIAMLIYNLENHVMMAMRGHLIEQGIVAASKGECVLAYDGIQ